MSDQDKTLKETIADAIDGNKETVHTDATETDQGISGQGAEGETKSGETPVYASGIDISDIPEQDRPWIRELLTKKAKLLEDGYQGKFKEVAQLKKVNEELSKLGITTDEARNAVIEYHQKKSNPKTTEQKKDALKTLDKLIEQSSIENRSSLEQMRTIILEETDTSVIKKDLEDIKKSLGVYQQSAMDTRKKQVDADMNVLSEEYGKDLIEKYRDTITEKAVQYPNMALEKIFQIEVPIVEIKQAILTKGKKPLTNDKKQAISSSGSGITSAIEKIDIKKASFADILMSGFKKQ